MNKKYSKGSISGGILCLVFCIIFIGAAFSVFSGINDMGIMFGVIFVFFAIYMFVMAIITIKNGMKSKEVKTKGYKSFGTISKLEKIEHNDIDENGYSNVYYSYRIYFKYSLKSGEINQSEEQISQEEYDRLFEGEKIPILIYKGRAVIDFKKK